MHGDTGVQPLQLFCLWFLLVKRALTNVVVFHRIQGLQSDLSAYSRGLHRRSSPTGCHVDIVSFCETTASRLPAWEDGTVNAHFLACCCSVELQGDRLHLKVQHPAQVIIKTLYTQSLLWVVRILLRCLCSANRSATADKQRSAEAAMLHFISHVAVAIAGLSDVPCHGNLWCDNVFNGDPCSGLVRESPRGGLCTDCDCFAIHKCHEHNTVCTMPLNFSASRTFTTLNALCSMRCADEMDLFAAKTSVGREPRCNVISKIYVVLTVPRGGAGKSIGVHTTLSHIQNSLFVFNAQMSMYLMSTSNCGPFQGTVVYTAFSRHLKTAPGFVQVRPRFFFYTFH